MRALILASMATLVLSGLPPAPLSPLPAQPAARAQRGSRHDLRALPPGLGRSRRPVLAAMAAAGPAALPGRPAKCARPAPPPPPPPPPNASAADGSVVVTGQRRQQRQPLFHEPGHGRHQSRSAVAPRRARSGSAPNSPQSYPQPIPGVDANRERYAGEEVAQVQAVADAPVSTFSIDVDTGSYSNVRRLLNDGQMPPQAAVRTEETAQLFPLRLSAARGPVAAVQHHHRHDDDAVERRIRGCCASACAATICRARAGRRPTSSSWSTFRDRCRARTSCRWCNARWRCSPSGSIRATGWRSSSMPARPGWSCPRPRTAAR